MPSITEPATCRCANASIPRVCALRQVIQKRQELTSLHPGARQCGRCGCGPVTLGGCDDLTTHHGQVIRRFDITGLPPDGQADQPPVDNSCPRCTRPASRTGPLPLLKP